jgi:phosphoesterase RecJ-like protein
MPVDWSPFVAFVGRHRRFVLMTHVRPDGDALGSMLALADSLRRLGKDVRPVIASALPDRYRHLDPNGDVQRFAPPAEHLRDADAVVIIDTGTWNQLGDFGPFLQTLSAEVAVIDHHRTQDDLGGLRFVDTSAEAAGRLAREAIAALGVPLTPGSARLLFVALATDTGWFRHNSTTPATHTLAAELIVAGARPAEIYDALYESTTLARLRLTGRVLGRMETLAAGRVALTEVYQSDYTATGARPQDTEDLVGYTRSVEGVEVGLLLIEQPDGKVKVSFRSRQEVDVAAVAEAFGGGGHRLASGATLPGPLTAARDKVLAAVTAALPA